MDLIRKRQQKKLIKLLETKRTAELFDPNKLIYNFTDRVLMKSQTSALMKCLKYGLPPSKPNEEDVFASFEMCFRNLKELPINEARYTKERFKNRFIECAYSYRRQFNSKQERNLTSSEWKGINDLKRDRNIVILRADEGNCVVLLSRTRYALELENMLNDETNSKS